MLESIQPVKVWADVVCWRFPHQPVSAR